MSSILRTLLHIGGPIIFILFDLLVSWFSCTLDDIARKQRSMVSVAEVLFDVISYPVLFYSVPWSFLIISLSHPAPGHLAALLLSFLFFRVSLTF